MISNKKIRKIEIKNNSDFFDSKSKNLVLEGDWFKYLSQVKYDIYDLIIISDFL